VSAHHPRADPIEFTLRWPVRGYELDSRGHVNNAVYLSWAEELATAHAEAAGYGEEWSAKQGGGWVIRHTEITYHRPAVYGDEVELTVKVELVKGARGVRRTSIRRVADAELLAEVLTEWVWVRLSDGRPMPAPPELVELAAPSALSCADSWSAGAKPWLKLPTRPSPPSTTVVGAVSTLNASPTAGRVERSTFRTRSPPPNQASTASTAGSCTVRHAVQPGVEKTTSDGRPSGDSPNAVHSGSARRRSMRRADHRRMAATASTTSTDTRARMTARSIMTSSPVKDAAPVELRHDEAKGAEVNAGIQRDHDRDRQC